MWNGVGGGTVVYAAHWQRNMPSDFRVRTLDGVADDWPLTYEDLEPYYVRVERDWGVSGLAGDTGFPAARAADAAGPARRDGPPCRRAHNELGWHWWPRAERDRHPAVWTPAACVLRATCLRGCADGAKASVDITYWPDAIARGAKLRTGARVKRLIVSAKGLVEGALYIDSEAPSRSSGPRSRSSAATASARPAAVPVGDGRASRGARQLLGAGREAPDDAPVRHRPGCSRTTCARPRAPGASTSTRWSSTRPPRPRLHARRQVGPPANRRAARDDPAIHGATRTRSGARASTSRSGGASVTRRCGGSSSRTCRRSRTGSSSTRIEPTTTGSRRRSSTTRCRRTRGGWSSYRAAGEESLEAAGAYDVIVAPQIRATGWHLLGTCMMGADPARSVVDPWGRSHDLPNLFIFDGSVWPTSSA